MGYTQIHSLQDSLHQNSKKSILSPKWTRQRQQLEASSTRMESMIPQSTRPSTPVTQENVTRTQHENVTTAVDREVHQDHHHTSVQPIKDREVLPEQHNHQMAGVETRNLKHGNDEHVKER